MSSSSPGNAAFPASQLAASQGGDDDMFSLDFTVPSNVVTPAAEVAPASRAAEAVVAEPPPLPPVRLDPVVEEAARLYASGQTVAARKVLEGALSSGQAVETAWGMLFDLYHLAGEQENFERLALEYAGCFEKSPPTWSVMQDKRSVAAGGDGRASVALTGALNSRCAPQFAQLVRIAMSRRTLRLDLAKIQEVDNGGSALLLGALQYLKKSSCEVVLGSAEHLAELLKPKLVSGQRENDGIWLLLLELYQRLNLSQSFEELALEYAITFEVSPPSWEERKASADVAPELPDAAIDSPAGEGESSDALRLSGELLNAREDSFAAIVSAVVGDHSSDIVINAGQLKRIDQNSANVLLKVLRNLPLAGRNVRITGVSHLVAAQLELVGIGHLVALEKPRY